MDLRRRVRVLRARSRELRHGDRQPPYGKLGLAGRGPRYKRARGEYCFIDVAGDLAKEGVFILPQNSAPLLYSGRDQEDANPAEELRSFQHATGIVPEAGAGIDTSEYRDDWRGVTPTVEVVTADFVAAREGQPETLW